MALLFDLSTPTLQDFLGDDKAKRQCRKVHFLSGYFGEVIKQARAALFLASDESYFINAMDFSADWGLTKAYVTVEGAAS